MPVSERMRELNEVMFQNCEGVHHCIFESDGQLVVLVPQNDIATVIESLKRCYDKVIPKDMADRYPGMWDGFVLVGSLVSDAPLLLECGVFVPSLEKQIVDDFYSLYHARFGERIRLRWRIDPAIELTETMIPSFLIQPLVENAIQHGLAPKEEGGTVEIELRIAEELLQITVRDDGVGMSQEALDRLHAQLQSGTPSGEHIGLYNVAARLRLSGRSDGLEIRSEANEGTSATIRLPLVLAEQEKEAEDE